MASHTWRFVRAGGFDQVALDTADDLRNLRDLDQKLWVALACPVKGNELDDTTLALVDRDSDGRIRAPDLLAAIAWIDARLVDLSTILEGRDGLALDAISDEGIRSSAAHILASRGVTDRQLITVADTSDARDVLAKQPFNGDGIVPPSSADDDDVRAAMEDALRCVGGEIDRNGEQGLSGAKVEAFWKALTDYEAWWRRAEEDDDTVVPLGKDTAPAVEAFVAVKAKIDDYFTRCDLAAFDPRAQAHLVGAETRFADLAQRTLAPRDDEIRRFPLAHIAPSDDLPLKEGINPAWRKAMATFVERAVVPLVGEREALDRAAWAELKSRFAAYEAWLADKPGDTVEALGIERIRVLLSGEHRQAIEALLVRDLARKPEADALADVDRAARYHRDLFTLAHNFVSFRAFYRPDMKAMFQAGTLFLDGRSCDLVLRVDDVAKHAATAGNSFAYLAYCTCTRRGAKPASGTAPTETQHIVAAFTDGDADFLAVGRNGVLYDRDGVDWDATIVKVVEQPISVRQAFWAPYKRLAKFLGDQAEAFAAARDKAATDDLTTQAKATTTEAKAASSGDASQQSSVAANAFDIGKFAGIFAAVGLAFGFIVSAATMLVTGFLSLRLWQMPLAVAGVLLLISGPSMLLAAFKLSRRNLAPLLDANGWAINTRARINIPFGTSLTAVASLPPGSSRDLSDPYADRRRPWWLLGLVVGLVCVLAFAWDLLPDIAETAKALSEVPVPAPTEP